MNTLWRHSSGSLLEFSHCDVQVSRYDVINLHIVTSHVYALWRHKCTRFDVTTLVVTVTFQFRDMTSHISPSRRHRFGYSNIVQKWHFCWRCGKIERLLAHKKSTCWYLFQILFWLIIPVRLVHLLSSDFANKIGFHLKNCPKIQAVVLAQLVERSLEKAKIKKKRPGMAH